MTESPLAVLFPVNMGNRGQNMLDVRQTFQRFLQATDRVRFVAFHPRLSGNFLFVDSGGETLETAVAIGKAVTGLRCLARRLSDLTHAVRAMPLEAKANQRGSVVLEEQSRTWRVIYIALSASIPPQCRFLGQLRPRIRVIAWPSENDAICLYDRPGETGDVGQVTKAVVARLQRCVRGSELYGTGRAMSIVCEILSGKSLRH